MGTKRGPRTPQHDPKISPRFKNWTKISLVHHHYSKITKLEGKGMEDMMAEKASDSIISKVTDVLVSGRAIVEVL